MTNNHSMSIVSNKRKNSLFKVISTVLTVAIVLISGGFTAVEQALAVSANFPNVYRLTYDGSGNDNVDAAADSFGNVHSVFERGGSLYYVKNRLTPELIGAGTNPAIAVTSAGEPQIAYISGATVKFANRTGAGWQPAVDIGIGTQADIDVDNTNNVHVAYIQAGADTYDDLLYTNNAGGSFAAAAVVADGQLDGAFQLSYSDPTIKIDGNGNYHIAFLKTSYTGDPASSAKYVYVKTNAPDGNSVSPNMGYDSLNILGRNSLDLDNVNNAYVVYTANGSAIYAAKVSTDATWEASAVTAGGGSNPAIGVLGSTVGVTYTSMTNIRYKSDTGTSFGAADLVDTAADDGCVILGADNYIYYVKSGDIYVATTDTLADLNPPIVNGVVAGQTYANPVTITFYDNEGNATATLDGALFTTGQVVSAEGIHTLIVTDDAGNTTTVSFIIALPSPTLTNIYQLTFTGSGNTNVDAAEDAFGNVHAVYQRSGSIYYKQNRGVEELVAAGTNPAIAVDSAGTPHVAFLTSGAVVNYTSRVAAAWQAATVVDSGTKADIAVGPANNIHLAYIQAGADTYTDLLYTNNAGGSFAAATVVADGKLDGAFQLSYSDPTIKIDGNGNYHIAYLKTSFTGDPASSAKYVYVSTNAAQGTAASPNQGYASTNILSRNSLGLDNTNNAYIAYLGNGNTAYRAKVTTNGTWDTNTIGNGGASNPSIAVRGTTAGASYTAGGNVLYKEDTGTGFGGAATAGTAADKSATVLGTNRYVYYEKSGDIYLATDKTIADTNPPVVTSPINGTTYTAPVTITYSDAEGASSATLNGAPCNSGSIISTNNTYVLIVTDLAGNAVTVNFIVNIGGNADTAGPTVTGVSEGGVYGSAVTIGFSDPSGIGSATLNGSAFASGSSVGANGAYTLIVTDTVGNSTTVHFTISISTGGGGGGGGGGGAYDPTVYAYNVPLVINSSQPGYIVYDFADGSRFEARIPVGATTCRTTYKVQQITLANAFLPKDSSNIIVNGKGYLLSASCADQATIINMLKTLGISITIPSIAGHTANKNPYIYAPGEWQIRENVSKDDSVGKISFNSDKVGVFSIIQTDGPKTTIAVRGPQDDTHHSAG